MKYLFFFLFPILVQAQDFQPIIAETNMGEVSLSENYIHFEFGTVQRVRLIQTNPGCVDLFAWSWICGDDEYWFYQDFRGIFLAKGKSSQMFRIYKVYKYKYNEIKE